MYPSLIIYYRLGDLKKKKKMNLPKNQFLHQEDTDTAASSEGYIDEMR